MDCRAYPHLFTPLKVKGLTFKNRIFSAPNANTFVEEGRPNDYYIQYMEEKARGGAALVMISEVPVDERSAHIPHLAMDNWSRPMVGELVAAIQQHGAVCGVELTHGGDAAVPYYNQAGPISSVGFTREDGVEVQAMDEAMILRTAEKFAQAAAYFQSCGVDMCTVHAAHHWLINQFLSPVWNTRTDRYGGSLENRCRFPIMVFQKIREAVGPDFVVELRFGAEDMTPQGNTFRDTMYFLQQIRPYIDMVHITAGAKWDTATLVQSTSLQPHGGIVHYAEMVKNSGIGLPVIAHGGIVDPEMMEDIVASGKADAVAVARALIADPFFPKKAQLGKREDIRPCLRCLSCLTDALVTGVQRCAVNPTAYGENRKKRWYPVVTKRDLLVIGGGPAGMQAAITAHDRGHRVTLVEKADALGGWLRFTDADVVKEDLRRFKQYLVTQVSKRNIQVRLNTEATPELVTQLAPDTVYVATGSVPVVPPIPGIELARHASEVYFGLEAGPRVTIVGGGLVGCEVALHLAKLGHTVTVIESEQQFARDANFMHLDGYLKESRDLPIEILTETRCADIHAGGLTLETPEGTRELAADTVLYATGMRAENGLYETLLPLAQEVVVLGDARRPAKVNQAIRSAWDAAMDLGDV